MTRLTALYRGPAWAELKRSFASPTSAATVSQSDPYERMPAHIQFLMRRIDQWHSDMVDGFHTLPKHRLSRRLALAGSVIGAGLHLRADIETSNVRTWLADEQTPVDQIDLFWKQRDLFGARLGDLASFGAELFQAANFALPSQVGNQAWHTNAKKLSQLLGGHKLGRFELGLVGMCVGSLSIARAERKLLLAGVGRQLRSSTVLGLKNRRRVDAANRRARLTASGGTGAPTRLDYSRGEHLHAAYRVLAQSGVTGRSADRLIDKALRLSDAASGKPWQGLIHLRELVTYADLNPTLPRFADELEAAITDPLHFSHCPGREWMVRDYSLARELLKADGKTCRSAGDVAVTQAGASIAPGVLASHPELLALAAHYMRPIQVYLNGMVAKSGSEHRRHKNVFKDFFRKGEVLARVEFIEATIDDILDAVEAKAATNDGRFDFKTDLAFDFPIRIICDFIGIPPERASEVQHWAEASVRALDAGAGLSLGLLTEGNRSAAAFIDYLHSEVARARAGESVPGIIGEVATTTELNDTELISNLAGITFAGFETTTALLSLGFAELLQHRDQWAYLRSCLVTGEEVAVDGRPVRDRELRWYLWAHEERKGRLSDQADLDRYRSLQQQLQQSQPLAERLQKIVVQEQALEAAVEEMLRWTAPGSVIPLTLEEDFVLDSPIAASVDSRPISAGDPITFLRGQTITVDIASANRTGCPFGPGQFEAAHGNFDISRTDNKKHLSFGVTHICMGADLAVENAKRMIEAILRRMGDLELDGLANEADGSLFIGLAQLPVRSASLATRA